DHSLRTECLNFPAWVVLPLCLRKSTLVANVCPFIHMRCRVTNSELLKRMLMRNAVRWVAAFVLTSCSLWAQKSVVVTVAGGYVGDHKSALEASLEFPTSVAFDREGNLYVADSSGCRVRIVNSQG